MKIRRFLAGLMMLVMFLSCFTFASAGQESARVFDQANVLTADQEAALQDYISLIEAEYAAQVVLVTQKKLDNKALRYAAEDFYKDGGFGYGPKASGVELFIVTSTGDYWIYASGDAKKVIDSNAITEMKQDGFFPYYIAESEWNDALEDFLLTVEDRFSYDTADVDPVLSDAYLTADGRNAVLHVPLTITNYTDDTVRISDVLSGFIMQGDTLLCEAKADFPYKSIYSFEDLSGTLTFTFPASALSDTLTAEIVCAFNRFTVDVSAAEDQRTDSQKAAAKATEVPATPAPTAAQPAIDKNGSYTSKEEVAVYIRLYGKLPSNYITKSQAEALGWVSSKGNLWSVAPSKSIGGDRFGNYEGLLPGGAYTECDIDFQGGFRDSKRLVFRKNGSEWQIYYTEDHYNTFEEVK